VLFTTLPLVPVALWRYRTQLAGITRQDLIFATLSGIALALHFAAWFESLNWTSVAASVTLVQAQPVFVALGAWLLLRERVTSRMTVGIAVAVAGMMAMSLGDLLGGVLVGPDRDRSTGTDWHCSAPSWPLDTCSLDDRFASGSR